MDRDDLEALHDAVLISSDDVRLGQVGQVFLDDGTGQPVFVTVPVGLLASRSRFVPLRGAELTAGVVTVPFARATIQQAPLLDPDGHLDPSQVMAILHHYGLPAGP